MAHLPVTMATTSAQRCEQVVAMKTGRVVNPKSKKKIQIRLKWVE